MAATAIDQNAKAVTPRQVIIVTVATIVYFLLSWQLVGFKTDQVFLAVLFNGLFYASPLTRRFILGFAIFIVYWIIFDYMKAFPNYRYNTVHIADLYNSEKHLFGIRFKGQLLTPNEFWKANHKVFLDVMSGVFYLCWVPVPLAFAAFLLFTKPKQFLCFALTFFLVNLIGFIIYYLYPAAPPWYVQLHGFNFIAGTPGNTGALSRFDDFCHAGVFKSIYAKSSNVFAAMPSLHSAYPVIVLFYGLKNRLGLINIFFVVVMCGIWFAAVYASHHYVLDVVAGIFCAILGIGIFNVALKTSHTFQRFLNSYHQIISK
ncbi:phosphatase PAP2 family protein [Mucilaginibacter ginkgonis]|uniref:Inositol phosphorylceramide synthase n=1 Tax=Mucilaginibacter ginkgonis TaxID=2682091 RepID=A0A6I4HX67_9SPHI|nr:phosphatase PAP2 family protein [Mucilaginibacter ginkgonis]QQL51311.1 inositol phosphorylceramide synthase [Mucilaginibacter ginkgonis]